MSNKNFAGENTIRALIKNIKNSFASLTHNHDSSYDTKGAANTAEENAKKYADEAIANLVNSAPETLDTLGELATAIEENGDVIEALNETAAKKLDKADYVAPVQSDWNQNDEESLDYIKNRPIYLTEEETEVVDIVPENTYEFTQDEGFPYCELNTQYELEVGQTYHVIWDGVEYEVEAFSDAGNPCIGANSDDFNAGAADIPFSIVSFQYDDGSYHIGLNTLNTSSTHAVRVFKSSVVTPSKMHVDSEYVSYLQSDWNQNDEESLAYVKNRLCYEKDPVNTVLIDNVTFPGFSNSEYGSSWYSVDPVSFPELKEGITYTVVWDGTTYECECFVLDDNYLLGNASIWDGWGADTGEPFLIDYYDSSWTRLISNTTDYTHTLTLSGPMAEVVLLDEKFISYKPGKKMEPGTYYYYDSVHEMEQSVDIYIGGEVFNDCLHNIANTNSHAEGSYTTASGEMSHAEGYGTIASNYATHAEGNCTNAFGEGSHAEGSLTLASGIYSHAEGIGSKSAGIHSHAEGMSTNATGSQSHAEGNNTTASGDDSHAEGYLTTASGDDSHAEGYQATASGATSHAEGEYTVASGIASHAEGKNTIAASDFQHVQGKWNIPDESGIGTYAHIVGNGSSSARSNAHTLDWAGTAWFAGDVYVGGTGQTDSAAVKLATESYADTAANTVKNDLLNGAGAAYDTLKELGDLINENETAIDALETIAAGKADAEHTHSWNDLTDIPEDLGSGGLSVVNGSRFIVGTSASGWTSSDCDYLCDGTSDDVEINAAIAALPTNGGEIVILDGTYNISSAIVLSGTHITLKGNNGATKFVRAFSGESSAMGVIVVTGNYCTIQGLTIDGVDSTYTGFYHSGIYVSGGQNNFIENEVTNNYTSGIYVSTSSGSYNTIRGNKCNNNTGYGIYMNSTNICNTISDNTCVNNGSIGIYVGNNGKNTVTGNTCVTNGNHGIGLYTDDSAVSGNVCNENTGSGLYSSNGKNNGIAGNTFNSNGAYGIQLGSSSSGNSLAGNSCVNNTSGDINDAGNSESPNCLPAVTEADNGKILMVVNGAWALVDIFELNGTTLSITTE